jgi:hypothetical protein
MLNDLLSLSVGDRLRFEEEKQAYTIQAKGDRYAVCTKPFNLKRTVLYTVVDVENQIRGTENLIFGDGAETREECEEMLARLEGRDVNLGFTTEISRRNNVPLNVQEILRR